MDPDRFNRLCNLFVRLQHRAWASCRQVRRHEAATWLCGDEDPDYIWVNIPERERIIRYDTLSRFRLRFPSVVAEMEIPF